MKRAFVILTLLTPLIAWAALTDNVVSYWKFDESSGNAADSVGSVTLTNNGTTAFGAGKIGNAPDMGGNGSGDYFSATDPVSLELATFSISAWVWIDDLSATRNIVAKMYAGTWSSPYVSYMLRVNSSADIEFNISNGSSLSTLTYTTTFSTGAWHHVVGTYVSGTRKIYLDGTEVASDGYAQTVGYSTGNFYVGNNLDGNEFMDGKIDELGIWSRAITQAEVTSLYNAGAGLAYPFVLTSKFNFWQFFTF